MSILQKLEGFNKPFKIFTDPNAIEFAALEQFVDTMEQDYVLRGALMPDTHVGYTLPIGGVVETRSVVVPAYVGYDIGCGMLAAKTSFRYTDIERHKFGIRDAIKANIPVGFNKRMVPPSQSTHIDALLNGVTNAMYRIYHEKQGHLQLGTLGGGNHFIEIGTDEEDIVWIVIHSGSRGVGHGCATHYLKIASPTGKATEGHYPLDVNSQDGQDYINDQKFCLEWALWNRRVMLYSIIDVIRAFEIQGGTVDVSSDEVFINRNHNHCESEDGVHYVHRKGATHAEKDMLGVVPGNMRDGSFIVKGKGNTDSLCSSSHGAGRVLGRKAAKRNLDPIDFENAMKGIVADVGYHTLDESPMAYKDIYQVMRDQEDLVEVIAHERPILVVKG